MDTDTSGMLLRHLAYVGLLATLALASAPALGQLAQTDRATPSSDRDDSAVPSTDKKSNKEKRTNSTGNAAILKPGRKRDDKANANAVAVDAALEVDPPAPDKKPDTDSKPKFPVGEWSGQYRPAGGGTSSPVSYQVCDESSMIVQIHLTPLERNRYAVRNAKFKPLRATFTLASGESRADCVLKRKSTSENFSGKCHNADGDLEVSKITMTSHDPDAVSGCTN